MKCKRRFLYWAFLYLFLLGINRLTYYHNTEYQQHPERVMRYLAPDPICPRAEPMEPLAPRRVALRLPPVTGRPDQLKLGRLRATIYHAVPAECDGSALETADGSRINPRKVTQLRWCAVSQDLLRHRGGPLRYGDTLRVTIPRTSDTAARLEGLWVVRDAMNRRHTRRIDFLVAANSRLDPDQQHVQVERVWKHTPKKH